MHQGSESNRQKCSLQLALGGRGGNVREKLGTGDEVGDEVGDEGVKFDKEKVKVSTTRVSE